MAATQSDWCGVSATSLGCDSIDSCSGAIACDMIQPRAASARKCGILKSPAISAVVAPPRPSSQPRRARCRGARRTLGVASSSRPACGQRPPSVVLCAGCAGTQADRQCCSEHLAERMVVVIGGPTQQVEGDGVDDRLLIQDVERRLQLRLRRRRIPRQRRPRIRPAVWRPKGTRTRTPGGGEPSPIFAGAR